MTLARRMWLASATLAILVGAAFTALVIAVSAQREATEREARSKDVTTASLQLEKLVSDAETGFRVHRHAQGGSLEPYKNARRELPARLRVLQTLVKSDPTQRARVQRLIGTRSGGTSTSSSPR